MVAPCLNAPGAWLPSAPISNATGAIPSAVAALTVKWYQPPQSGLVCWLPADGNAADVAGSCYGTLENGASFAPGKVGQAFSFDGVDDYVHITGSYWISGSRSIAVWVYPHPNTGFGLPIVTCGATGAGDFFGIAGTAGDANVGQYKVYVDHWGAPLLDSNLKVIPDAWNHVAMTFDGSTVRFYVNGVAGNTVSWGLYNYGISTVDVGGNHIGGTTTKQSFNGLIDEVLFYNRALSEQEVKAMFQAGTTRILAPLRSGAILAGDTLRFAGQGTDSQDSDQVQYLWDFGDGQSSTLQNPGLITFSTAGSNLVTLDVTDSLGLNTNTSDPRIITVIPDTNAVPDFAVSQLNIPSTLAINQPAQITYTVRNIGDAAVSGQSWNDALYISRDQYLDANDSLLVSAPVSNNVATNGSYTNTLTVTIPTVEEGAWYLILSVDDEWQILERHQLNNEFAVATDLVIPQLTNAAPFSSSLSGDGDEKYFRIDVPAGENLLIRLDDADNQGANEIYVRFGALPTRGTFDFRAATPGSVDQQLLIPAAAPGTYYIMVHGESVPGSGQFTLQATTASLDVSSVTPARYGQNASAVLTVTGAGFDASAVVELVASGGAAYRAASVSADSFTQLTATFNLSLAPVGTYSLRVSSPLWSTNTLANAFEVLPAGEAKLETSLIVPGQMGYHVTATIYVEYRNTGNAAMPAPLLVLTATQNGHEGAFLTLDSSRLVQGFWTSAEPEGFTHSIQILASGDTPGVLQPGESFRVPVYYAGWQQDRTLYPNWAGWDFTYPPFNFNLGVLKADDTNAVNWSSLKASMKPATISTNAWDVIWAGFVSQAGTNWGGYVQMLDDNAAYLGRLGERVVDIGQLLSFKLLQADGLSPLRTLASAVDGSVEAPGLPLVFSRSFAAPISQRFELGPLGRGWSHNWQYSLQLAADGTVTILGPGGSRRTFQPDSRDDNNYFPQAGDHATLASLGGGAFSLTESGGLLRAFRSDGKLEYVEDLNGNRITASYNGNQLAGLVHSSGQSLQFAYNGSGRIKTVTDSLGRQTTLAYGSTGEHLTNAVYYDGRMASYAYGAGSSQHALTQVASSCCNQRYFTYDAQGRLSGTYLAGNAEAITFSYDSAGKVTATDALSQSSKFYFDNRGLLAKTEDPLGNGVHITFDDSYNLARLTDPAGRSYSYAYDTGGNLTRSTDPLGHASSFTFTSSFNRLASVTDANTNVTRYAYTSSGNLQSIVYADGSREGWAYDGLGNATTWTNRRSRPISYAYDAAGRITNKAFADGSRMTYAYDSLGDLTNAATLDSGLSLLDSSAMFYDSNDRLTNITFNGGKWLSFTYDSAGRRASSLDQLGHWLTYHYDAAGRLQSMTNELSQAVVGYEYDPVGRLSRKTLGNGVYTLNAYDPAGQLLALTNFLANGGVLSRFNYTYDSRGRRAAMDTLDGRWAYEYDDLGQLTHAVFNSSNPATIPNQDLAYIYDALGNRVRTIENGVTTEYTANNLNQYIQVGSTNYVFDADGNLIQEITSQGTNTFTYNDENRLTAVHNALGDWQYVYDSLGNRVTTTENGATTRYVIDPIGLGNVVGEYDSTGSLNAHYDHGLGLLSRTDAAGNPAYYTFDAIGNVQQLVTAAGTIANAYAYAPFGALLKRTESIPNPFQFVGQFGVIKDANDLIQMRSRFYKNVLGHFTSEDLIGIIKGDFNLRRYAFNNPNQYIDPNGQNLLLAGAIVAGTFYEAYVFLATHPEIIDWGSNIFEEAVVNLMGGGGRPAYSFKEVVQGLIGDFLAEGLRTVSDFWEELRTPRHDTDQSPEGITPFYPGGSYDPPFRPGPTNWEPGGSGSSTNSASGDPNSKTGPAGFGTNGCIAASGTWAYRINFENETNATAPAQQVVISDQLDGNLDWSTFQLTEIGWADQLVAVPPNTAYFQTNVPVSCLGTNFEAQIEAGVHASSGAAYAIFRSIDPATSLPPPVNIGFLPPENGTGRGQGHFSYTIRAKTNLVTGTQVRNVASISFDNQPAIRTDQIDPQNPAAGTDPAKQCPNTIDADPPVSRVNALDAYITSKNIKVTWSGTDVGSGLASYDIYVSTNGGPWKSWLLGTTNTSALFAGGVRTNYAFCSAARDSAGNVELLRSQPDAQTTFEPVGFPFLTKQPVSLAVLGGGTASFSVTVNGAAPLQYQWKSGTNNMTNAKGKVSGATAATLTISAAAEGDEGAYYVVVSNKFGSVSSSNAILQVLPGVKILSPAANAVLTNATVTVTGTASEPLGPGVAQILWQLNGSAFSPATGTTNWTAAVTLRAGTNVFGVKSVDRDGDESTLVTRSFFFNVYKPITLVTNGPGGITGVHNGQLLLVGKNYPVTATPRTGNIFSNWTGTITSYSNPLVFLMQSNMVLTGNFVTNMVLSVTGVYNGLFFQTNALGQPDVKVASAGMLGNLTVGATRSFSGRLYIGGTSYLLTGAFNLSGEAQVQVKRTGLGPLNVTLHLDWTTGSKEITGSVSDPTNGWTSPLIADLAVYSAANHYRGPSHATTIIPYGAGAPLQSPGGYGYGALSVSTAGVATLSGNAADGALISQSAPISKDGYWPFYVNLYKGKGVLIGWMNFTDGGPSGTVTWVRQAFGPAAGLPSVYAKGFTNVVAANGAGYTPPASGHAALVHTNLTLQIGDASITPAPLIWNLGLKPNNQLQILPGSVTNSLTGSIVPASGTLSVTFRPTGLGKTNDRTAQGAVLQTNSSGWGFFIGTTNAGSLYLHP